MLKPFLFIGCFMALTSTGFSQTDSAAITTALKSKDRETASAKADVWIQKKNRIIVSAAINPQKAVPATRQKSKTPKKGSSK